MSNVLKFNPVVVGEGFRFDPDELLESAKGTNFITLAIIGEYEDGTIWIGSSANAGEMLVLMERAKHKIIWAGDD